MSGSESPRPNSSAASNKSEPTQSSSSANSPQNLETVNKENSDALAQGAKGYANTITTTTTKEPRCRSVESPAADLTRQQIKWIFAATCYAFGVLKRDFSSSIDNKLIEIVKSKLDDEPGFHDDTPDFGNKHFQGQFLDQVVREIWEKFLDDDSTNAAGLLMDALLHDINNHHQNHNHHLVAKHNNYRHQNHHQHHHHHGDISADLEHDETEEMGVHGRTEDYQQGRHRCRRQWSAPAEDNNSSTSSAIEQQQRDVQKQHGGVQQQKQKSATPNCSMGGDSASSNAELSSSAEPCASASQVRKVYLGGLSDEIDESELRAYFKEYGTIADINIVLHKDTGKRRGFAFVEYNDCEPVDKVVAKKFHTIKGRRIEAKKAIPKIEMDARKRVDQRVSLSDAMQVLRGVGPAAYLWADGLASHYAAGAASAASHHLHQAHLHAQAHGPPVPPPGLAASSSHASNAYSLDHPSHHHYPHHHYHGAVGPAVYAGGGGAGGWLLHGGGGGEAGAVASAGRANGYPSQATSNGGPAWAASVAAVAAATEYGRMPAEAAAAASPGGAIGPMRAFGYGQHGARGYRPYANAGQRNRSFK